jgi:hypothetical protein
MDSFIRYYEQVNNCVKIKEDQFTPCAHCEQRTKCEAAGECLRGGVDESDSSGEQIDLGYNLDAIEDLLALLAQYHMHEGKHFASHVGYGDSLPNAITIPNSILKRLSSEQLEEIRATASASHDGDEGEDEDFRGEYGGQFHEKNAQCTGTTKKASRTSKGD